MNDNSIIKGLTEAISISKGEIKGRRQTLTISRTSDLQDAEVKSIENKSKSGVIDRY